MKCKKSPKSSITLDPWQYGGTEEPSQPAVNADVWVNVQVYQLIAKDTIEEKILELQKQKSTLLDTVSSGEAGSMMHMNSEELLELLKI